MVSTLVYCIRHGQTAENLQGIIQGQLDTQLDEVGIEQAAATGEALKDVHFDMAFSSDLTRAVDTANAILKYHDDAPLERVALLRERFMGNLQGQVVRPRMSRPAADDTVETSPAFQDRILQFWDEKVVAYAEKVAETHEDRPACMLVVSHGAYISTLVRALIRRRDYAKSPEVEILNWCPNASLTLVEVHKDGTGVVRRSGDTLHLVKPAVTGSADDLGDLNGKSQMVLCTRSEERRTQHARWSR